MNIVICDDESRRDGWRQRLVQMLGPDHTVELLDSEFKDSFRELTKRREDARGLRKGQVEPLRLRELPDEDDWEQVTLFDRADVLLVDYDLFKFDPHGYLTGAIVAYMARCYSRCGVIVGVNELGQNPFDLTLLDNTSSFSDLTIGDVQLDNPGLWSGIAGSSPSEHFRPWSWPALLDAAKRQEERFEEALGRLGDHVLDVTGLAIVEDRLPRSSIGWLERASKTKERTTLDDLARGKRLGYRRGDEASSRESVARVAAARAAKWIETAVLPLQDVLIDAPHLVQRNPALLEVDDFEDFEELEAANWSATTRVPTTPEECGLRAEVLAYVHPTSAWLSRPAFYWPKISASKLPGIDEPYRVPAIDKVFCEDVSAFLRQEESRRFVSKLDSSFPARWLANPKGLSYSELLQVEYQPMTRLAI